MFKSLLRPAGDMFKKLDQLLGDQNLKVRPSSNYKNHSPRADVFDFIDLIKSWTDIVGPRLSKQTIPLKNDRKALTILTKHSAYSEALKFQEENLKEKIFDIFPSLKGQITRLYFQTNTTYFDQAKADLLQRAQIKNKGPKKEATKIHEYDPRVVKLKREAEERFQEIEDQEIKSKIISIFIQSSIDN